MEAVAGATQPRRRILQNRILFICCESPPPNRRYILRDAKSALTKCCQKYKIVVGIIIEDGIETEKRDRFGGGFFSAFIHIGKSLYYSVAASLDGRLSPDFSVPGGQRAGNIDLLCPGDGNADRFSDSPGAVPADFKDHRFFLAGKLCLHSADGGAL